MIQGSDSSFYGTTFFGGAFSKGTIFKRDSAGTFTTLHEFSFSDGAHPYGALIQASDGTFYGTATEGGPHGRANVGGVVFRLGVGRSH
jgi:uncharacterized repeat protein (TIGR03803 family)